MNSNNKSPIDVSKIKIDPDIDDPNEITVILEIIQHYFDFDTVSGTYTPYKVNLDFGRFKIIGQYDCDNEIFSSVLLIDEQDFFFNFYPHGSMGGLCTETLNDELKRVKDLSEGCSLCVVCEGYVVFAETFRNIETLRQNFDKGYFQIYMVYGKQLSGDLLGRTNYGDVGYEELKYPPREIQEFGDVH